MALPQASSVSLSTPLPTHAQSSYTPTFRLPHACEGTLAFAWPGSGVKARIQADPGMEHVIVYSPEGENFFAVEPVTNANDGINLLAQGITNCGVVVLKPGEALKTGFQIVIET